MLYYYFCRKQNNLGQREIGLQWGICKSNYRYKQLLKNLETGKYKHWEVENRNNTSKMNIHIERQ